MDNAVLVKAIIENAIDGIITINEHGIIETINPAGCVLFGYTAAEVIGKNICILMPQPDREHHDEYLANYQRTHVPKMIGIGREVQGLTKNGTVFPFRLALSEVKFTDRVIYTGFVHDLTREKAAEAKVRDSEVEEARTGAQTQSLQTSLSAMQSDNDQMGELLIKEKQLGQLKSRFVSMASHEFRTPLSAVLLSASLIEHYTGADNPNITKHVAKIKNAVDSLTLILNDFLLHENLDAGKIEANFTEFDVIKLCEDITEEMQLVSKRDQTIIYQHTGLKNMYRLDPHLLKACIINIISNAIKYSGENTFIEFNTEITHHELRVMIRDYGIGIPESDHAQLFEPFFRAHNTGSVPGTGLGLNIVRRYCNLMNGSIEFKSNDGGTSFTFIFPA